MTSLKFIIITVLLFVLSNLQAREYKLVWSDEFDGTEVDLDKWEFQIGTGTSEGLPAGWGNNELQYYREENAQVADGRLVITAYKEPFQGNQYTSARLRTKGKADFKYGKMEARIKFPSGQGFWPAFWMYPTEQVYGGWAASGEIDIVETVNIPTEVHGTIHFGGSWPDNASKGATYSAPNTDFSKDFHVYTLEWEEKKLRWFVDGEMYSEITSWWSSGGAFPAPFDQKFHFIVNLAVGGNWPGSPNASTEFPQDLLVDWIRVYQKDENSAVNSSSAQQVNQFVLEQNYPNPFNSYTQIRFHLPAQVSIRIEIFDLLGQKQRTLLEKDVTAGMHQINWNGTADSGKHLASGIYFYRLWANNSAVFYIDQKKLVMLK